MEQRDYLEKQIEQLGKVLGELFVKITGLGSQGKSSEGLELVDAVLNENLDLNIQELLDMPEKDFILTLEKIHLLNNTNLEMLADIFVDLAQKDALREQNLLARALLIYEYLEKSNRTFSFTRNQKIEKVKQVLN